MKNLFFILVILILSSCEDVINVDLPTAQPQLVIDGLLRIDENRSNVNLTIKAFQSSSYFTKNEPANLSEITILNTKIKQQISLKQNLGKPEEYTSNVPLSFIKDGDFLLNITYKEERYTATASYLPSISLDSLKQGNNTLFDDKETEVILYYTDIPQIDNYYLFDFGFGNYLVTEDTFYQGQPFNFSYYYDTNLKSGDTISVSIMTIDKDFYTYMDQLITLSENNSGPFQTPISTVQGNLINSNNKQNKAFGYFAVVQYHSKNLIIE